MNTQKTQPANSAAASAGSVKNEITLTVAQIKDLAEFVGLVVKEPSPNDDMEVEITLAQNKDGLSVREEDDTIGLYPLIAYFEEYPEEGTYPLSPKLSPNTSL